MFCPACNAEMPADAAFCPKCGHRLAGTNPAASASQAATAAPANVSTGSPAAPSASPAERFHGAAPAAGAAAEPEQELWRGRYSPKAMYGAWLLAVVVTIGAILLAVLVPYAVVRVAATVVAPLVWLGVLLTLVVRRASIEYIVTNQRLLHHEGLLSRRSNRIMIIDIDDVSYEQGPLERLFDVGTIEIISSDRSNAKLPMNGIDNVHEVANLIDNARREERRKRAVFMESV